MKPLGRHLILIGFMGSGKTSVGLRLSYKLQVSVEDTDKLIERSAGKSIRQIFDEEGESAFRRMETEMLYRIMKDDKPKIYSLGGGTPVQLRNQPLIKKCGTVVYLKISPEAVYERLKGDTRRPLLQCDDPYAKIRKLLGEREPAYARCADITVEVDGLSQQEVVSRILRETGNEELCDEDTGGERTQSELSGDP